MKAIRSLLSGQSTPDEHRLGGPKDQCKKTIPVPIFNGIVKMLKTTYK